MDDPKAWTCGMVRQVMHDNKWRAATLFAMTLKNTSASAQQSDDEQRYIVSYCDRLEGGKITLVVGKQLAIEEYLRIWASEPVLVAQLFRDNGYGFCIEKDPRCKHKMDAIRQYNRLLMRKTLHHRAQNTGQFLDRPFVTSARKLSDVPRRRQFSNNA